MTNKPNLKTSQITVSDLFKNVYWNLKSDVCNENKPKQSQFFQPRVGMAHPTNLDRDRYFLSAFQECLFAFGHG